MDRFAAWPLMAIRDPKRLMTKPAAGSLSEKRRLLTKALRKARFVLFIKSDHGIRTVRSRLCGRFHVKQRLCPGQAATIIPLVIPAPTPFPEAKDTIAAILDPVDVKVSFVAMRHSRADEAALATAGEL